MKIKKVEEVELEYKLSDEMILVKPTKEYEKQVIEYKQEFLKNGENKMPGSSNLDKMESVDEWLESLKNNASKDTVEDNWAVSTEFLGIRKRDNKVVGMINIRHELEIDYLKNYVGHIGYSVRPSGRRKGYATQMLNQALRYCKKELNLNRVMISCNQGNEGSRKTIINAGGILEREYKTEKGEIYQIYGVELM